MELSPYIAALRENLTAAAAAGDEQTRATARVLAATIEPAARLAIMNALSDLAAEVTVALDDRIVDVRLNGQDVQVVVSGTAGEHEQPAGPPPPPPPSPEGAGDISRITVRIMEEIKARAEEAAAAQGVSLNSFIAQAVQGALSGRDRGGWSGGGWGAGANWPGGPWQRAQGRAQGQDSGGSRRDRRDDQSGRGGRGSSRVRGWVEG